MNFKFVELLKNRLENEPIIDGNVLQKNHWILLKSLHEEIEEKI